MHNRFADDPVVVEAVRTMTAQGLDQAAIGQRLGVTQATISRIMAQHHIVRGVRKNRPRGSVHKVPSPRINPDMEWRGAVERFCRALEASPTLRAYRRKEVEE